MTQEANPTKRLPLAARSRATIFSSGAAGRPASANSGAGRNGCGSRAVACVRGTLNEASQERGYRSHIFSPGCLTVLAALVLAAFFSRDENNTDAHSSKRQQSKGEMMAR
jgi:hypothetical protein